MPNELLPVSEWRGWAFVTASVIVLLWDVFLAAQIARARRQEGGRVFRAITALCGLLVAPALVLVLAGSTMLTGRTTTYVAWVWPATLLLFVVQSGYALLRRLVTALVALPIFLLNVSLFAAAAVRYAGDFTPALPSLLLGTTAAVGGTLGLIFGKAALWSPLIVQLPLLAPAYPARWRVSRTFRALVATAAAAWATVVAMEYPRAVRATATFAQFTSDQLQERPGRDFELGLRVLPAIRTSPSPVALRNDLALADTLDAAIISIVLDPSGVRPAVLDSVAAALDDIRRDSVQLAVSIGWSVADRRAYRASPAGFAVARLGLVDQVVRRLRPDVLLPALDPLDAGESTLGTVPLTWWRDYLVRSARLTHRLRPRTRVGVAASAYTPRDSMLYGWASQSDVIDITGFSFAPSYGGGASLAAQMRIAERWMKSGGGRKEQWIFAARGYPRIFGEANQERGIWGAMAWATTQRRVKAVIIDGAGDYESLVGMRAPGGRLRPVVAVVDRARRAIEESAR